MVNLAVLACVLRTTTKKGRQLFEEKKKCTPHPQRISWLCIWFAAISYTVFIFKELVIVFNICAWFVTAVITVN